jgi:hypothetical protein
VFFAGSARYLLPIAAPLAILVSRQGRWLPLGFAAQLLLALGLSIANYQHWDGYRQFVATLPAESDAKRVWINGEWGLQYYAEARGGLALKEGQPVGPGEYVVSSELGYPIPYTTGGGLLTPLSDREIRSTLPFRLIALNSKSAYSTVADGYRAFDISSEPIDRVHEGIVIERKPTLSDLPLNSPEAASHIVSGFYALENTTRWMSGRATVLLKRPTTTAVLRASIYIPDTAPARTITLYLDGKQVHSETIKAPGAMYQIKSAPIAPAAGTATVTVAVDKTFHVSTDRRELGAVLVRLGFE